MPKYIDAYQHIPTITGEELEFLAVGEIFKELQEENPGLELNPDQPLPMDDALNERVKENAYKNADSVANQDGYESGEISNESDSGDDEEEPADDGTPEKGDGTKTRKRFRRAVQNQRRKALELERPEIRQLLEKEKWVPKKMDNGWWLKDGCWLCKRCAHMNVGSNKHCYGCDMKAPDATDGHEARFFADPNWMEMSRTDGKQFNNKWKRDRIMYQRGGEDEPDDKDVSGLPLIGTRGYSKQEGLFGGDFCWDERAVHPHILENRARRAKHVQNYKKIMKNEGITEMPDDSKFCGLNSALITRCKERIVRAMQRKALDQKQGIEKDGYLNRWRKNYSQSGWWCDSCDYFTFFPHSECHECRSPRPGPQELWKHAYRRNEREEAVLNIERSVREQYEEPTNYFVGKGRYASVIAPDWLDERTGVRKKNDQTEIGRRTRYFMNRADDLATESQKLAAYNMMVFMTKGTMGNSAPNTGVQGIPMAEEGQGQRPDPDSVLPEVQAELDAERKAIEPGEDFDPEKDEWINNLTSAPLLDSNNQFLAYDDKLEVYKKLFDELTELNKENAELDSSDDEEEAKEKANAAKILAAKKRKEEDFRSHLAFLHHEDFIQQLGEEIGEDDGREINRETHENRITDEYISDNSQHVKVEPQDDEEPAVYFGNRHRSRFAEELENLVPDAIIDLSAEDVDEDEKEEKKDGETSDDDYYNPQRDRHAKVRLGYFKISIP